MFLLLSSVHALPRTALSISSTANSPELLFAHYFLRTLVSEVGLHTLASQFLLLFYIRKLNFFELFCSSTSLSFPLPLGPLFTLNRSQLLLRISSCILLLPTSRAKSAPPNIAFLYQMRTSSLMMDRQMCIWKNIASKGRLESWKRAWLWRGIFSLPNKIVSY